MWHVIYTYIYVRDVWPGEESHITGQGCSSEVLKKIPEEIPRSCSISSKVPLQGLLLGTFKVEHHKRYQNRFIKPEKVPRAPLNFYVGAPPGCVYT